MSVHKPSDRRRSSDRDLEPPELNLLPFMNLMTLLIPFLLVSIQFVTLAVIDSSLPAIGQPQPSEDKDEDEIPPLNLTVGVTDEGFTVAGSAAVLGCEKGAAAGGPNGVSDDKCTTIGLNSDTGYCAETVCKGDDTCNPAQETPCHDYKALHDLMIQLKEIDANSDNKPDYGEPCRPPEPAPDSWQPPETCNVIIAPNPDIQYHVIVGVMDATRDYKKDGEGESTDLFPYVVIAGGVK